MHRAAPRLSRVLIAGGLAAFAASGAAAAGHMFLKLQDIAGENPAAAGQGHGEQIEIHSIQWGAANAAGPMKPVFVKSWSTSGDADAQGEWIADVERPAATARRGTRTVDSNETITIHGARTESTRTTSGRASSDITMKGSKIGQNRRAGGDTDRPIVIGSVPNPPKASPMQYNPKELSVSKSNNWGAARATPAAKGSVWIRVATPWAGCRVGTRYPGVELADGTARYQLSDAVVTGCDGGGVSLDYAKVTVRGWDPAKKEE